MKYIISAEAKKILFLKGARKYLLMLVILSVAAAVLLCLTTPVTTGRRLSELRPDEVLSMNLLGVDVANIMLIVFTALGIHREFSTKMIQVTLPLTPYRLRFLGAKFLTYFGLSWALGVVTVALAYLVSQALLVVNGMPSLTLTEMHTVRMLLGVMVMPVFYCLLTLAATFIFWNSAAAITFSLGVLAAHALVGLLPGAVRSVLLPLTPQSAIHNLAGMSPAGSAEEISLLVSAAVLVAWIAVTAVVAGRIFQRKDL